LKRKVGNRKLICSVLQKRGANISALLATFMSHPKTECGLCRVRWLSPHHATGGSTELVRSYTSRWKIRVTSRWWTIRVTSHWRQRHATSRGTEDSRTN